MMYILEFNTCTQSALRVIFLCANISVRYSLTCIYPYIDYIIYLHMIHRFFITHNDDVIAFTILYIWKVLLDMK